MQRPRNETTLIRRNFLTLLLGCFVLTQCESQQTAGSTQVLLQVLSDNGNGLVVSQPEGISCGTGCTHTYDQGTVVQLTATQVPGTYLAFASWGGACSGTQPTCSVTLQDSQTVIAYWGATPDGAPRRTGHHADTKAEPGRRRAWGQRQCG